MKIRIKNIKKLPKAQFAGEILKQMGQSLPKPSYITMNGVIYNQGDPGYDEALKESQTIYQDYKNFEKETEKYKTKKVDNSTITATSDPKFVNISRDDANQNNNGRLINNLPNVWNKFGEENAPAFKTPDQPEMYKISEENKRPVDEIKLGTEKEKKPFDWNQLNNLLNTGENLISQMGAMSKQYKNTRMLNQAKLNQAFNQNIMPGGDKGGYDINTGMLPYNSANQGMYSNAFYAPQQFRQIGGQTSNEGSVKIKIKSVNQQPSMAYGGQSNYALDVNRDYSMFDDDNYDSVSNTLQPVDRSLANVEAEKGETVYGDLDGDGGLEHMKIGGKRHHSGGTPLNLPEDSFIYSDTKKMKIKDEVSLAFFGLKPKTGGYTPAEIAKKYDVNKYKAVMEDPNADDLDKSTAQLMVKNYNDKLSRLALIQEEMKGFPQGIPEVAKEYAIEKGMINPEQSPEEMIEPIDDQEEMQEEPMMRYGGNMPFAQKGYSVPKQHKTKSGLYGNVRKDNLTEFKKTHQWYFKDHPNFSFTKEKDVKDFQKAYRDEAIRKNMDQWFYGNSVDGLFGNQTLKAPGFLNAIVNDNNVVENTSDTKYISTPNGVVAISPDNPMRYQMGVLNTPSQAQTFIDLVNEKSKAEILPNVVNKIKNNKRKPFRYTTPDIVNMAAAAANAPELILGYNPQMPFTPGNVMLQDPRAQLAAQQAAYNSYADTIGAYAPSQSISAALSYAQAQQADKAAQILAQNQAANVAIANQFSQQERQRQDQNNLFNLGQKQQNWKDYATAKQNYRQERVDYTKANADAFTKAWDNRMKMNLMNETNQIYNIDPITGRVEFMEGYGPEDLTKTPSGSQQADQIGQLYTVLQKQIPGLTADGFASILKSMSGGKKYGGPIKKKKKGGQVNPIFDMLSRGYSYPF